MKGAQVLQNKYFLRQTEFHAIDATGKSQYLTQGRLSLQIAMLKWQRETTEVIIEVELRNCERSQPLLNKRRSSFRLAFCVRQALVPKSVIVRQLLLLEKIAVITVRLYREPFRVSFHNLANDYYVLFLLWRTFHGLDIAIMG